MSETVSERSSTHVIDQARATLHGLERNDDALITHEQCIQDFYEVWKLPEDVMRRQSADYFDVAVKVRDQIVDQTMLPRLSAIMRQHIWIHYSDAKDLPESMALARPAENPNLKYPNTPLVTLDVPMHPKDVGNIKGEFTRQGSGNLPQDYRRALRSEIRLKYTDVIVTSPQFTFLQSLGNQQPSVSHRRLSLSEKQLAATAVEAAVRTKYGLKFDDDLRTIGLPHVAIELARPLYQLDEETKLDKQKPQTSLESARQFIMNDVRRFRDELNDDYYNCLALHPGSINWTDMDRDLLNDYSIMLDARLGGGTADLFEGHRLIANYILRLFDSGTLNPNECLDRCVNKESRFRFNFGFGGNFTPEAIIRMRGGQPRYVQNFEYDDTLQPIQLIRHQRIFPHERGEYNGDPSITSREEFERRKNQTIMAAQRKATTVDMVPMRLITFPDLPLPLPEPRAAEIEHADLTLEYQDSNNRIAQVAGYELFAAEGSKLYFRKNPDDDPERLATAPIPTEGRQRIIDDLKYLGVTAPLKALSRRNLTVDGLVKALREASDYTFDQVGAGQHQLIPGVRLNQGRLQLQCDGAAFMLDRALNLAFENSAHKVSGLVLKPDNLVSAAAHEKVSWTDGEGREFYLDATPGYGHGEKSAISLRRPRTGRFSRLVGRTMLRQAESPNTPQDNTSAAEPTSAPEKNVRHSIIETLPQAKPLKQELEQQLYPLLKVATADELYKKVVALTADDPIRRTAEAVVQAQQGTLEPKTVERLADYLVNLETSDDAMLKKLGVPKYHVSTLRLMRTFVQLLLPESKL